MTLSRRGIAYNLTESPHRATVSYGGSTIEFVFSSELYRNKFLERLQSNREVINTSLSKRFDLTVNFEILADIRLYKNIEKRGFLLIKDGEHLWQNNLKLDGDKLTSKS